MYVSIRNAILCIFSPYQLEVRQGFILLEGSFVAKQK